MLPAFQSVLLEISLIALASVQRSKTRRLSYFSTCVIWMPKYDSQKCFKTKTVRCCTFSIGVFLGADSFWPFSGLTAADTAEGLTSDTKKERIIFIVTT